MTISVHVLLFFSVEDESAEFLTSLFKIFILKIKLVSEIVKLSFSLYLHHLAALKFQV
jgi:hypothetical protein